MAELPSAAETSIGALAACNAERDVHKLSCKFGLTLPVQICQLELLFGEKIPVLPLSSWAQFLMSKHLWFSLSGLEMPDLERAQAQWSLFWDNFRNIRPNHHVFCKTVEELSRTAAIIIHGDEGRSKKKTAILIISAHSALGRGTSLQGSSAKEYAHQSLNALGNTLCTRWLLAALPRHMYDDERSPNLQMLLQALVEDLNSLFEQGFKGLDGMTYYFATIHVIGDWPWLQKAFDFQRSFSNISKHATANTVSRGICHVCLADQPNVPFEDFDSEEPKWRSTCNLTWPFASLPALYQLPYDPDDWMSLPGQDLFHGWHLGAGKVFLASSLVLLSEQYPGKSIDARFSSMAKEFFEWCAETGEHPYIRKLTREMLSWTSSTDYPTGTWSKGSTTLCLLRWFLHACKQRSNTIPTESILRPCYTAAQNINKFLSKLYRQQVWIPSDQGLIIAAHGLKFLKYNGICAKAAHAANRSLFLYMPNLHRLHHIVFDLKDQSSRSHQALSPLLFCCQVEEDYIGKPSRVSRRCSPQQLMLRTIQRSLEASYNHYVEAGLLIPDKS